jgi:hypothetical protein
LLETLLAKDQKALLGGVPSFKAQGTVSQETEAIVYAGHAPLDESGLQ